MTLKSKIIKIAKKHALTKLKVAHKEGGDYWNTVMVDKIPYDYNLYDYDTNGRTWGLSVYPLKTEHGSDDYYIDTQNPIIEGLIIKKGKK